MNENFKKFLYALPFCIPFQFFLICDFYYRQNYIRLIVWVVISILYSIYEHKGRKKEMFAGSVAGSVISVIATSIANNGFDESRFAPLSSISTVIIFILLFFVIQLIPAIISYIYKKVKEKKEKSS